MLTRMDATVDFDWGSGSPDVAVAQDHFFARWTGTLAVETEGLYTLTAVADDGVRLWVDGVLVINRWETGAASDSGSLTLTVGSHNLTVEYFDETGDAALQLLWSSPAMPEEIIPTHVLTPPPDGAHSPVLAWTGEANYRTEGVYPKSGVDGTVFTYRVKYMDVDADAPAAGHPRVHILSQGVEIVGSPFGMVYVGGNNLEGVTYTYAIPLPAGKGYAYFFDAKDATGLQAVGVPNPLTPVVANGGPVVGQMELADIDQSGRVDGFDLGKLAISFGARGGDAAWNAQADLNADQVIDGLDLDLLIEGF